MLRTARISQPRVLVEDSAKRSPCGLRRRFVPTLAGDTLAGDSLGGVGSPVRGASAGGSLAIVMSPKQLVTTAAGPTVSSPAPIVPPPDERESPQSLFAQVK